MIGDVHASLSALEAVLADIGQRGIKTIYNVGDLVGYGGSPQEVVDLLRTRHVRSIMGNLDERVVETKAGGKKKKDPIKQYVYGWTRENLRPESVKYLRSLPRELRFEFGGKKVLLVHGSPAAIDEYIQTETPLKRLRELAKMAKADVVVAGHAHEPFVKKVGGVLFINTGSVGRPGAGGDTCHYAIFGVKGKYLVVEHVAVKYDLQTALAALKKAGMPPVIEEMIVTGKTLEEVQAEQPAALPTLDADALRAAAKKLAEDSHYEAGHTQHVTELAVQLFDQLIPLHNLTQRDRLLLELGGLLHDIGLAEGPSGHHKQAMKMILSAEGLPLGDRDRLVVANVARYHRRALPARKHKNYRRLSADDQTVVRMLAGILRLTDGLDRRHASAVESIKCRISPDRLTLSCRCIGDAADDLSAGRVKSDLLAQETGREIVIAAGE